MRDQTPSAPYGWASVCAPGRARAATRKAVMRPSLPDIGPDFGPPPKMGWEFRFMGKPGTRGHARMVKRMAVLREKGGMISS